MNRDFLDHLEDTLEFASKARDFGAETSWEKFAVDDKTQFAIIRALEVIGEAARRIPTDVQKQYASIPWRRIIGMRNILAHNYDNADPRIIFDTANEFVPVLIDQLRIALDDAKKKKS